MHSIRAALLASTLVLGACTTDLHTRALQEAPDPHAQIPAGFVYHLPAAVVKPSGSIRVAACPVDEEAQALLPATPYTNEAPPITKAGLAVSGDIAVDQVAGQPVLIDYRELASFLKTSSVGIERHPNLMLKSVNVSVEDQTPQLIANLAVIASDVAMVGVKPPLPAGAFGPAATPFGVRGVTGPAEKTESVSYLACNPDTAKLVAKRDAARDRRDAATDELEQVTDALQALMRDAETGFTQEEIATIHGYRAQIVQLTAKIADATDALTKLDAKLSLDLGVPPAASCRTGGSVVDQLACDGGVALSADGPAIAAFVAKHFVVRTAQVGAAAAAQFRARPCASASQPTCRSLDDAARRIGKAAALHLTGTKQGLPSDGDTPRFDPARQTRHSGYIRASQGIVYVEPARYDLVLKQDRGLDGEEPRVLKAVKASIPQLGTYIGLPIRAGFGEKVELKATFNTDGSLATASYAKPVAGAVALSGALAGLADKALATRDAIADRKLKLLKAEAERLNAQQSVIEARAKLKPAPDPLADLKSQIAVAEANATLAEANLRIRRANADKGGQ